MSATPNIENLITDNAANLTTRSSNPVLSDWRISVLVLIALWAVIYMVGLSRPPLLDDVDSVHAEAGREMAERGDWVTVYTNGIRYMEKAPFLYWSIAASYKMFGIKEWTARLPLMIGVIALVLSTYVLGRHAYGATAGFYAGLALLTCIGVYLYTRFLIPEVLIALWFTLGYYFFLRILDDDHPSRFVCWGFAATCALNVLTKGLIGLVFPIGAIGLFILLTSNWRVLLKMRLFSSILVFFTIAAPWHVLAAVRTPAQGAAPSFLWLYFINEHLMRFLGKRVPPGFDTAPLGIFWGLTLAWLIPWIAFLPQSLQPVRVAWRELRLFPAKPARNHNASLLFFLWAFVILAFFSFSTRQEYYAIPALPGMALLVGGWLARESEPAASESDCRAGRISSTALLAFGVLALVAGTYLLSISHRPTPGADLADLLKKNPEEYNLSLGHVLDLTPQALGAFRGPLLGVTLGLFFGTALNWFFRRRRNFFAGNAALAVTMVVLLACVHSALITFSPILSSYDLAEVVRKEFRPGDVIVIDGEYHEASTLNFYTGIPVHVLHEPSGNLWYGAKFPDAPKIFETRESLSELWKGSARVFLWADNEDPKELHGLRFFRLASSGGKFIFTNHNHGN